MSGQAINNWQAVQDEVLRRIHRREWKPGEPIPNEADLAQEFGCARATVNRALRTLAENGILDRRRKAGTRVALHPVGKATLDIPVIRHEVEAKGMCYDYRLLDRAMARPPAQMCRQMQVADDSDLLYVRALHLAARAPYVIEDRWINHHKVAGALDAPFAEISANEWLLANAPYTHGQISFSARNATPEEAALLNARPNDALFWIERTTFDHETAITSVTLSYAHGYRMNTEL